MKFHLEFDIKKLPQLITHKHRLLLIGSCFTENIGEKLKRYKFSVLENPHGILFNPISVAEAVTACIDNRRLSADDLFEWNEGWHSWRHHSRFSGLSPEAAKQKIHAAMDEAHHYLRTCNYVMVTLGSAWVYTLTEKAAGGRTGAVAANNHKAPADWFHRRLLTTEEVLQALDTMMHRLFLFNPDVRIIFTISPVRHAREGVVENNRSKAALIQAVHHMVDKFDRLFYFPAYELVIDDLRDYRFYAEDLVHPNYHATQYVWEKFVAAAMSDAARALMEEIHAVNLAHRHKPFQPSSAQHRKFLQAAHARATALQEAHPYLDFQQELTFFSDGLKV